MWRDTAESYGLISLGLHWLTALLVPALFTLGLWMLSLDYYHAWYQRAPEIHKGVGIVLFALLLGRVLWRWWNGAPRPEPGLLAWERRVSRATHIALYLLAMAVMFSGYLISTADARPIDVFGLFQVPATIVGLPNQADVAGRIHWVLAIALMVLVGIHALAALKHHFLDRDRTLLRMLGH